MKTRLILLYLKNYRGIHHLFTLLMYLGAIFIMQIFEDVKNSIELQCIFITLSYLTTQWTLKKSGLTQNIEKELRKREQK